MQHSHSSSLPQNANSASQPTSYPTYYNSHYLQAYAQSLLQPSQTSNNAIGYNAHANFSTQGNASRGEIRSFSAASSSSWYQHGHHQCTYNGCAFTGSAKSVELHMMDRHLIYPPGWEKRKKRSDWDADPSLKGKPIPIQGTNVILDSPEVLEAWIAERKRRFPTSSRVDEKKRKMEEAVARGQLDLNEAGLRASKRRKTENLTTLDHPKKRSSTDAQRYGAAGHGGHDRVPDSGWGARSKIKQSHLEPTGLPAYPSPPSPAETNDDDDQAPEIISSKMVQVAGIVLPPDRSTNKVDSQVPSTGKQGKDARNQKNAQHLQPKMPVRNPFAARPKLLRNLLLPEIRVTVSNLSQAIRFLVDNDFLRDVELKPGKATERNKIEVMHPEEDKGLS